MLRAAVIGLGAMGRHHARVYRELPGVELVGVADVDAETARRVGSSAATQHFSDIQQMLDTCRPNVASVAVPTAAHASVALELIRRGVHVLIEKPIASNVEQAEEICLESQRHGVVLGVGHIERFNPAVVELRRRLAEGMAGRIYQMQARRLSPYPARIGDSGVVLDLASHDIDLIRHLIRDDIVRLYGETLHTINSEREDLFNGTIRFRGGALGILDVNWITPCKVRTLTVTGGRGMFRCDLLSQELFFYENEAAPSQWDQLSVLRGVSEGNVLGIRIRRVEPLAAELLDFVESVRTGRAPAVTGLDGLETLRLALDFVRSGEEACPIVSERRESGWSSLRPASEPLAARAGGAS